MWNGIGWYGFIGVITTSTTDISLYIHILASLSSLSDWFGFDMIANREDIFTRDEAHLLQDPSKVVNSTL